MQNVEGYLANCEFEDEQGEITPCKINLEKVTLEFSLPYSLTETYKVNIYNDPLNNRAIILSDYNGQPINEGEQEILTEASKFVSFFCFGHHEEVDE